MNPQAPTVGDFYGSISRKRRKRKGVKEKKMGGLVFGLDYDYVEMQQ